MSYDYEEYDGKRIVVDGEIIGVLAMEFGHEVEEVWEEYHAELAMTEEQERQSEAYKESLRRALSAQYEKVATLEAENAKLRLLLEGLAHCHEDNPHETCPLYRDTDDYSLFENWCRRNELAREFGVDAFDE